MSYDIFFVRRDPGQTFEDALDDLELMQSVYDLAHAVEDVTGLEGYDPQLGEPVSDRPEDETPTRRRWPDDVEDEDDTGGRGGGGAGQPVGARTLTAAATDPRPEMAPDVPRDRPRRWWEFWKS